MPAALLLARTSGLYCRILVPLALRALVGRRYLVRSLGTRDRDEARLTAALLAIEARAAFAAIEEHGEQVVNPKDILKNLDPNAVREFGAKKITLATGTVIENPRIRNDDDLRRFNEFVAEDAKRSQIVRGTHAVAHAVAAEPVRPAAHEPLLSKRKEEHALHSTTSKMNSKTVGEFDRALRFLIECCGDKPPADYTATDADLFEKMVQKLPLHHKAFRDPAIAPTINKRTNRQEYTMLAAPKMVELNATLQLPIIDSRTQNKHMDRVRRFFNWCIKRHYMGRDNFFAERTFESTESTTKVERVPFSEEDVARIFAPETFLVACNEPHKFWGPLLAQFTGGRRNEIGQLYVADVIQDAGRWGIGIDAIYPNQRVKNKYSKRSIPLHSKVIELGFIQYVADVKQHGFDRLFPTLPYSKENGYGDTLADTFHRYLRSKRQPKPGAKKATKRAAPHVGIDDPKKVFHSFRYRFCNRLYQSSDDAKVKEMSGHERPGVFSQVYAGKLDFDKKVEIIERLSCPPLEIPPYKPGQWDAYFAKAKRSQATKQAHATAKAKREAGEGLE